MRKYLLYMLLICQIKLLFGQVSKAERNDCSCVNYLNKGNTLEQENIKGKVLSYKSTVHEIVSYSNKLIYKPDLKRNHVHETFLFDNNGNYNEVMSQYLYLPNGRLEDILTKKEYKYDNDGKNVEVVTYKVKDTVFTLLRKEINVYDSHGNNIEIIKYEKNDLKTKIIIKKEKGAVLQYYYDKDGELVNDIISLKFDKKGNEIERINLNSQNNNVKSIEIKKYDSNNNQIRYSYEGPIGKFECEYKYDDNNNVIEKKCTSKSGTRYNRYEYVYDSYCNWIQKIETIDGKHENVTLRVYEYR